MVDQPSFPSAGASNRLSPKDRRKLKRKEMGVASFTRHAQRDSDAFMLINAAGMAIIIPNKRYFEARPGVSQCHEYVDDHMC